MSASMILALCAAIASAIGYGVATILQALAARRAPGLAVIRQPLAVAGLALDAIAWAASLVALEQLPLFIVQTIVGSSLVVVVLLAGPILGVVPRRADMIWVIAIVLALTVVAVAAGEQPAKLPPSGFTVGIGLAAGMLVLGVFLSYRRGSAWILAGLASLGYGIAALAARAMERSGSLADTVLQPLVAVLLVGGAVGVVCFLRAVERGSVGQVMAVLTAGEMVVPVIIGFAVLGDTIRQGWVLPAIGAGGVALVGCIALASSPAHLAAER